MAVGKTDCITCIRGSGGSLADAADESVTVGVALSSCFAAVREAAPLAPLPTRGTETVLVVDDEPGIVEVISMALRFQGFEVETAGTGREAIAAVSRFHPDLMACRVGGVINQDHS